MPFEYRKDGGEEGATEKSGEISDDRNSPLTTPSQLVVVVQSLSHIRIFATPWTAACQASLSFTISQSWLKLVSIESVMPSNNLILCGPLLLLSSVFPSVRVFSNESALHIRWPKYCFGNTLELYCRYIVVQIQIVLQIHVFQILIGKDPDTRKD